MNNKVVIFFTNNEKLQTYFKNSSDEKLFMSEADVFEIKVRDCIDSYIYIVHDQSVILETLFDNFSNLLEGYFIYHDNTNDDCIELLVNKNFRKFDDHHIKSVKSSKGYYLWLRNVGFFNLINSGEISAHDFIKLLNKLSSKAVINFYLNLLHEVFSGIPLDKNFEKKYGYIIEELHEKSIGENLREYLSRLQPGYCYDNHDQILLEQLRDALLTNTNLSIS